MKKYIAKFFVIIAIICLALIIIDRRSFTAFKVGGYNALKVLEQKRASDMTPEFHIYSTEHFIIKYKKNDEDIIDDLAGMLERGYNLVGQAYNYFPKEKAIVFIYESPEEFGRYEPSIKGQAVMGLYKSGVIHILSPNAYAKSGADFLQSFEKDGPVLHEYVHKVIDDLTGGNINLWFTEGLALYEEYAQFGTEWAPGFKYKEYYSIWELEKNFMRLNEVQAYRQSFDIVRNMIDRGGREKVIELISQLKSYNDFETAFNNVYGIKLDKKMKTGLPVFQVTGGIQN